MALSGPFASKSSAQVELCNQYWWTNLLYISNFYPASFDQMCFGWSWYLAVDFQLFVVLSPPLLALFIHLKKSAPKRANFYFFFAVILPLLLASTAYRLWGVLEYNEDYLTDQYMNLVYGKSYARAPPFLFGIFTGAFLSQRGEEEKRAEWTVSAKWLFHVLSFLGLVACIVPLYFLDVAEKTHFPALNVAYTALFPLLWGASLAWITVACYDRELPGQRFFELSFFAPLGRLGLSVYLVHPIIIFAEIYETLRLPAFSWTALLNAWFANSVFSYAAALVAYVVIEYPIAALAKGLLVRNRK